MQNGYIMKEKQIREKKIEKKHEKRLTEVTHTHTNCQLTVLFSSVFSAVVSGSCLAATCALWSIDDIGYWVFPVVFDAFPLQVSSMERAQSSFVIYCIAVCVVLSAQCMSEKKNGDTNKTCTHIIIIPIK